MYGAPQRQIGAKGGTCSPCGSDDLLVNNNAGAGENALRISTMGNRSTRPDQAALPPATTTSNEKTECQPHASGREAVGNLDATKRDRNGAVGCILAAICGWWILRVLRANKCPGLGVSTETRAGCSMR